MRDAHIFNNNNVLCNKKSIDQTDWLSFGNKSRLTQNNSNGGKKS